MILYIYSKCSTCQNALRFLQEKGILCEIKEITISPPSIEELKKMLVFQQGNLKKLFNTSGLLYKEMKLTEKWEEMKEEEALFLLSQHGMLVKRPFLIGDNMGFVGFKEKEWDFLSSRV